MINQVHATAGRNPRRAINIAFKELVAQGVERRLEPVFELVQDVAHLGGVCVVV